MNQKELEWFGINKSKRTYYKQYGNCINLSTGLIIGVIIDKVLIYLTKGLSIFIPPFAVMLMTKGKVLKQIRFEKQFPKPIQYFLNHFIEK